MKRLVDNLVILGVLAAASAARADEATVKLYKAQCASCHGLDGKGKTTVGKKLGTKDWTDPKILKPLADADVENVIRTGKRGDGGKELMPSFAKLGDEKIKALAAYIRTFQPK